MQKKCRLLHYKKYELSNLYFLEIFIPFHSTSLFAYSLKILKKLSFSDVFRRYRKRPVAWNGLSNYQWILLFQFWMLFHELNLFLKKSFILKLGDTVRIWGDHLIKACKTAVLKISKNSLKRFLWLV